MINSLINMNPIVNTNTPSRTIKLSSNPTIEEYAFAFIDGMSETQRNRFKKMLENGIQCGMSVADNYGIDYNDFITEVKKQLKVEV